MAQKIFFPYQMPLTSTILADFHGVDNSVIVKGLELKKVDDNTVTIKKGVFYIVAANDSTKKVKVVLDADETVNVSATSPLVYATLTWADDPNISVQFTSGSSVSSSNDLVIGKCIFDGSGILIGFDYTDRNELEITDRIRTAVQHNLLVNGSFEDWLYNSSQVLVPVGWTGNATISSTTSFSNKAAQLASGGNTISQTLSNIYTKNLIGKVVYLNVMANGGGSISLIFKDSTGTEIYTISKSISTAEYTPVSIASEVPSNTGSIVIEISSSASANLLVDNVVLSTAKINPAHYTGEEVNSENIEFLYFDSTNPPNEMVVSNSPVIVFPSTAISTAYFSFTYPSKFTSGMNVLLKLLTSISSATTGIAKFTIDYTIIEENGSITQSSASISHLIDHAGAQNLITSGVLLPTKSYSKNAIVNVKITRDPNDASDTLNADVYLFGIQLIEGGAN